jgi:PAS domain S-box-containing protein
MARPISVLHVDDDSSLRDLTATFLERENDRFTVETAASADDGFDCISNCQPDCIVSDYNMPDMDGIEFLRAVREEHPECPFILFTGQGGEEVASDAIAADATDYLQKGTGPEQYELLANRIENAVRARREAERADRQDQLMRLTEFAGDTGGFELDTDTGEILMTAGARRITGLPDQADLSLDDALDLYHPDDREEIRQAIDRVRQTGEQTHGTWRIQPEDGGERLVDVTFIPSHTDGDTEILRGSIHDITDHHERQQELEEERRFVQQALDSLDDLFYVVDTDGTLQRWNETARDVTGYTESELDSMPAIELFPEDEREDVSRAVETTLADGEMTVEADVLTADDRRVPYEFTGSRLIDEDGTATGLVGVGRDLTERRQREQRFRALVEESNDIVSIIDADGRVNYQSPSLKRVLGRDPEEMAGDTVWEYIHPDDRDRVRETFEEWVANPTTPESVEYRAAHADGSWRWMEARAADPLDSPAVEGYVVNRRDVTDQREREQELKELKGQYETLAENFPDGAVYLIDGDLECVRARGEELRRVGLSPDDLEGATPHDLFPEEIADELCHYYEDALNGTASTFEQEYEGERYRIRTTPVQNDGEAVVRVMAVSQNITEHVGNKQALERQNERLEEFASIVSHDLRSPLGVAESHLELAGDADESEHLTDAKNAIERSQALIDDLLALAREGDRVDETEPVDIAAVAESSWRSVKTARATLDAGGPRVVEADRSRLQQLFENLYRNSVEHGGDDVTVSVGSTGSGFFVADTGPGVPESERENIFEAGYSTTEEGTGFGLRIVEQIADAHGWGIAVAESEQGGARFDFTGVERVER